METPTPATPATADREIVQQRVFSARRELVWQAWTHPEHVDRWWGPNGFTTTTHEKDVRVGGVWRFNMHGPDGTDFPNRIVFTDVVRPERLAYDHGADDGPPHFQVVVTFAEQDGKTALTMRSLFPTAEARDFVVQNFGAIEGGKQTLDRFAAYLATL